MSKKVEVSNDPFEMVEFYHLGDWDYSLIHCSEQPLASRLKPFKLLEKEIMEVIMHKDYVEFVLHTGQRLTSTFVLSTLPCLGTIIDVNLCDTSLVLQVLNHKGEPLQLIMGGKVHLLTHEKAIPYARLGEN